MKNKGRLSPKSPLDKNMKRLRPGDLVTVRSFHEIFSTLDASGALDDLPFLPEMLKYCGHSFKVRRPVHKLIQEGVGSSMRRIKNVVLLDGTICDGRAHDDCQRLCFPLWKIAWLKAADGKLQSVQDEAETAADTASEAKEALLPAGTGCQVTELMKATEPLALWHPLRHYWDLSAHTYSPKEYMAYILGRIYKKTFKRAFGKFARGKITPPIPAPPVPLGLKSGDFVEVKSAAEIWTTLNIEGKCRGLYFMPGMWDYCGRRLRVLQPIERMMSEKTGEMRVLNQTVILEGVTCDGKAHGGCQRGCYVFWKDAWLKRLEGN